MKKVITVSLMISLFTTTLYADSKGDFVLFSNTDKLLESSQNLSIKDQASKHKVPNGTQEKVNKYYRTKNILVALEQDISELKSKIEDDKNREIKVAGLKSSRNTAFAFFAVPATLGGIFIAYGNFARGSFAQQLLFNLPVLIAGYTLEGIAAIPGITAAVQQVRIHKLSKENAEELLKEVKSLEASLHETALKNEELKLDICDEASFLEMCKN